MISILATSLLLSASAFAKPEPKLEYPDQYRVDFSEFTYRTPVAPLKDDSQKFEVAISANSWAPRPFATANRLRSNSTFESSLPTLNLGFNTPAFTRNRIGAFHAEVALGLTRLERSAKLRDGTSPSAQSLYLIPLSFGVRAKPEALHAGKVQGYLSVGAGPLVGFSERSVFDDGETHVGIRGSAQAGIEFALFGDTQLDLYGLAVAGSINSQNINGLGAGAGLGVKL